MERIFHLDYEMLGIIDLSTKCFNYVLKKDEISTIYTKTDSYYDVLERAARQFVGEQDYKAGMEQMDLSVILAALETKEVYAREYTLLMAGKELRKKWRFSYLDEEKKFLLVGRMDAEKIRE